MLATLKSDLESKDFQPEQIEERIITDLTEEPEPDSKLECETLEESENVFATEAGEKIKSIKNDFGLLIYHENNKNECVKVETGRDSKCNSANEEDENEPPALPPRPPPRPRQSCTCTCELNDGETEADTQRRGPRSCWANGLRKYVFLCTACGSLSILLGTLFLIVYFMLKSYTSSLNHFETIPTYVPSGMLIATGFLIICLACRKNRNSFLMKLCGLCSLCCAVLCVSVTVTTTVIHMNRLQTLRECLYTLKTQSCTCYSVLMDNDRLSDEGIKFVFNSTPDCEVIHGGLYSCLRAIFGLSVIGILVCIFSCMLVYQLLSHEKKKMYWAQLEMRCRYLYRQQRNPHYYSCCDECRYPPHPHELFPWDLMGNRFWSTGRIGNLYTPNPEDRTNHSRLRSGWNWRRLPWSRSSANSNEPTRGNLGSPDSQYGFSSTPTVEGAPYTVLDPRTSGGITACHAGIASTADISEGGFYSWGPPPPYASNRNSANNSPARRSLGEILHQVSPIRRNDNVSPARGLHHVHRHHVHQNRPCNSSTRQMLPNAQNPADLLQKMTTQRTTPITNATQQQNGMDPLWNNSLSSIHRFQKVMQNKVNYENMYDSENILPTNGFNTLPSLKKRNQPRVSDIFQDETSTAYFFSSAENLGCSNSNIKMQTQVENLSPRVFLKSNQPNTSRYSSRTSSVNQSFSLKSPNDLNGLESSTQPEDTEGNFGALGNRRSIDRNTSLVRKLFVNCSPSKQKLRNDGSQFYSIEGKDNFVQTSRTKFSKKIEPKDIETSNENVITFRYRVGIPKSPNVQNFHRFTDKPYSKNEMSRKGNGNDSLSNDISESDIAQVESKKLPKSTRYITKDFELLQKHGSLIKEMNKNIDLHKVYKNSRGENTKASTLENENFSRSNNLKQNVLKTFHSDNRYIQRTTEVNSNFFPNESLYSEDYLINKTNENESDVYFGDISNSSCYMSLQNDGMEYEETEERNIDCFSNDDHSVLNKQNLKIVENENFELNETVDKINGHSDNKRVSDSYNRQPSYRHQRPFDGKAKENFLDPAKLSDTVKMNPRRLHYSESIDKKKIFNNEGKDKIQQPEYHQESINSNDEQSSGSLTADSGISTGRNFLSPCLENTYHEIPLKNAETNIDEHSDAFSNFHSFTSKISNLNFCHPLFQKPKVLPRGSRYNDVDIRQKKYDVEELELGNDLESENQNKRNRNCTLKGDIGEINEEVSNQLLSTCNLTLNHDSDHFLEDEHFDNSSKNQENKEENCQGGVRKSPKPLPRTSVLNRNSGDNKENFCKSSRYLQEKEKVAQYIAPDAQYEIQENLKGEPNSKKTQNLTKNKPAVPARPLNLEHNKNVKTENLKIRMIRPGNELNCPIPRRRQITMENDEEKDNIEIRSHSVNV